MLENDKYISASIMCANMMRLDEEVELLEDANIDYFHIDIMDGEFVPNHGINLDVIKKLRVSTNLPFDYHLMVTNPEEVIRKIDLRKNDMIAVHLESRGDIHKISNIVKGKNAKFGIAINPETKVEELVDYVAMIDFVLIMLVNPGFSGQPMVKGTMEKVKEVKQMFEAVNNYLAMISIDGNVGYSTIKETSKNGANVFVAGTTCLFKKNAIYENVVEEIKAI